MGASLHLGDADLINTLGLSLDEEFDEDEEAIEENEVLYLK